MSEQTPLIELIYSQASLSPDNVAIIFQNKKISYKELTEKIDQLSSFLNKQFNITKGDFVSICIDRNPDILIAILALMKLEATFIPIDPYFPKERIYSILKDAKPKLVLTESEWVNQIFADENFPIHIIDWKALKKQKKVKLPRRKNLKTDIAYILYTSGSTGKPKGILIRRESLTNFISFLKNFFKLQLNDLVPLISSYTFDISLVEYLLPLVSGAICVIIDRVTISDAKLLYSFLKQYSFEFAQSTPSMWETLTSQGELNHIANIVSVGEVLNTNLAKKLLKYSDNVYNAYGPTESTIWATLYKIEKKQLTSSIPIGKPIKDIQIYILDKNKSPTPPGKTGELHISGTALADGYLNLPTLTNKRFAKNPFDKYPYDRIYSTGDLVKELPNGNLIFIGRSDNQVKIRGYRVELHEIQTLLLKYPSIKQVHIKFNKIHNSICVYIITNAPTNHYEIKDYLKTHLPSYMVPNHIIELENLPLTPHGKIDEKLLPNPIAEINQSEESKNKNEDVIKCIWSIHLNLPKSKISRYSNFFDLGGNSLKATLIIADLRSYFHADISLRTIFDLPTIELLLSVVEKKQKNELESLSLSNKKEFPLLHSQKRLWFMQELAKKSSFYNVISAFRIKGNLNVKQLKKAFKELIKKHDIFQLSFIKKNNKLFQKFDPSLNSPFLTIKEINTKETNLDITIDNELKNTFNLETEKPYLFSLLVFSNNEYILLMKLHHIIIDGWSLNILYKELSTFYNNQLIHKSSNLKPPEFRYVDFADWHNQQMNSKYLDKQIEFWKNKLNDLPNLNLHYQKNNENLGKYFGNKFNFEFEKNLSEKIKKFSNKNKVTTFTTIYSSLLILLSRYTQQLDFGIGMTVTGRHYHSVLKNMMGLFVNMLVLRTKLNNKPSFYEVIKRAKQTLLEAFENQDVPFEKVAEACNKEHALNKNPLCQVMIVFQNYSDEKIIFKNCEIEPLLGEEHLLHNSDHDTSKFDLSFFITENENGLQCSIEYSSTLYNNHFIEDLTTRWKYLFSQLLSDPDKDIFSHPLLKIENQLHFLTSNLPDFENCEIRLHKFIEKQATHQPKKIAVKENAHTICYEELNTYSNHVVKILSKLPQRASIVGLFLNRSIDAITAILGIFKSNMAYTPINPNTPQKIILKMLQDTNISLVLTNKQFYKKIEAIKQSYKLSLTILDINTITINTLSSNNHLPENASNSLAYVLFTSGSTGTPKGVMIRHESLTQYRNWFIDYSNMISKSHVDCSSNIAFDFTISTLLIPLTIGATIHISSDECKQNIKTYLEYLTENQITHVKLTPSYFNILVKHINPSTKLNVKKVILGGEQAIKSDVEEWLSYYPQSMIHNEYGPTETTIAVSQFSLTSESRISHLENIPIDQNSHLGEFLILDEHMNPTPPGVPGNFFISGTSLSDGYINNKTETRAFFVKNPFSSIPSTRLYKTNDLVKYYLDGSIEYLGRLDEQTKINGYRFSSDYLKKLLLKSRYLSNAAVQIKKDGDLALQKLLAYVIANSEELNNAMKDIRISSQFIESWKNLYNKIYYNDKSTTLKYKAFLGWNSSYTNKPFPTPELDEWLDDTVSRIQALKPKNVLEVGSGAGLILFEIINQCSSYTATDFSKNVIHFLEKETRKRKLENKVDLLTCAADKIDSLASSKKYDLIIVNSVAQYFPSLTYLENLIQKCISMLDKNSKIFIGDVRSFEHLEMFHHAVEPHQESSHFKRTSSDERELVISPTFFLNLKSIFPDISHVEIQLKQGFYKNEINCFRYDVIMHINNPKIQVKKIQNIIDWADKKLSLDQLEYLLSENKPSALGVRNIINSRLSPYFYSMKEAQAPTHKEDSLDPADLYRIAKKHAYYCTVQWSQLNPLLYIDVIFYRENDTSYTLPNQSLSYSSKLSNHPLQKSAEHLLEIKILNELKNEIPCYLLPKKLYFIGHIPLTPNDKVDFHRLAEITHPSKSPYRELPNNEIQKKLFTTWETILGKSPSSISDNFFHLGGHSLLMIDLIAKMEDDFSIKLKLTDIFENQTIE